MANIPCFKSRLLGLKKQKKHWCFIVKYFASLKQIETLSIEIVPVCTVGNYFTFPMNAF
jgi:hypothetical protein